MTERQTQIMLKKEEVGIKVVREFKINLERNNFFPNTPDCGEAVPMVNEQ